MNRSTTVIAMLIGGAAVARGAAAQPADAPAQQSEALEEVVVTGSYLKRSSFDEVGSPIDVVDRAALDADAPTGRLTEILRHLPQNVGEFDTNTENFASVTRFGGGTVDLRGLGAGATLVLLNGRRQTRFALSENGQVDANSLVPNIMLQRVEVLNDGASAVYGTDAVGGVVNFITRSDFEGVEFRTDARGSVGATDDPFDHHNWTVGALLGGSVGDAVHLVAGFEYFRQEGLEQREIGLPFGFLQNQAFGSSFGMPGSYNIPLRDANGALTGELSARIPDPDCDRVIAENVTTQAGFHTDTFQRAANTCALGFSMNGPQIDEKRWSARTEAEWRISDSLRFQSGVSFTRAEATPLEQASLPVLQSPVVPGEHPGNPFRAVDADGSPLFALDGNGDAVPDRDAAGTVLLAPVPQVQSPGTVPFNEDVQGRFRPASTTNYGLLGATNETRTMRLDGGLLGELSERWSWQVGWAYSQQEVTQRAGESIFSEIQAALDGQGGATGDRYFNPFGSSLFAAPGDALFNTSDVFERILTTTVNLYETSLWSLDGVVSGDLFALPAGDVRGALGVQYREEELSQDFDALITQREVSFIGNGERDFTVDDRATAAFLELGIPLFEQPFGTLDLTLAGRYERQGGGTDSFNPKISLLFQTDRVDLRSSIATSFTAPTLFQRFGRRIEVFPITDPLVGDGTLSQVPTRISGNPDLDPQESDSLNVGVTIRPIERLRFSVDYWRFEFEDLLAVSEPQGVVDADPTGPLITRNANGEIVFVDRPFFNAGSIEADGLDIGASYDFAPGSLGTFTLAADFTTFLTYEIQELPGRPIIDGLGFDNNNNIGSPIARVRGNVRLGWAGDSHSGTVTARYHSDVDRLSEGTLDTAEAEVLIDAQYSYSFPNTGLTLTAGATNLFNQEPDPLTNTESFYIRSVQDERGRMVYLSMKWAH